MNLADKIKLVVDARKLFVTSEKPTMRLSLASTMKSKSFWCAIIAAALVGIQSGYAMFAQNDPSAQNLTDFGGALFALAAAIWRAFPSQHPQIIQDIIDDMLVEQQSKGAPLQ